MTIFVNQDVKIGRCNNVFKEHYSKVGKKRCEYFHLQLKTNVIITFELVTAQPEKT